MTDVISALWLPWVYSWTPISRQTCTEHMRCSWQSVMQQYDGGVHSGSPERCVAASMVGADAGT